MVAIGDGASRWLVAGAWALAFALLPASCVRSVGVAFQPIRQLASVLAEDPTPFQPPQSPALPNLEEITNDDEREPWKRADLSPVTADRVLACRRSTPRNFQQPVWCFGKHAGFLQRQ